MADAKKQKCGNKNKFSDNKEIFDPEPNEYAENVDNVSDVKVGIFINQE